jgi:hypothetical protein
MGRIPKLDEGGKNSMLHKLALAWEFRWQTLVAPQAFSLSIERNSSRNPRVALVYSSMDLALWRHQIQAHIDDVIMMKI